MTVACPMIAPVSPTLCLSLSKNCSSHLGSSLLSQQVAELKAAGTVGLVLLLPSLLVFPDLSKQSLTSTRVSL